jgi:HUS1 checkpoint protein
MIVKFCLSDRGIGILERKFLPTLEKFRKKSTMMFTRDTLFIVQQPTATSSTTDELQITLRLAANVLFEPGTYRCQSSYQDTVAFDFDVSLALKVLRSAASHGAATVDVKLTNAPLSSTATPTLQPALRFTWRGEGHNIAMVQYLPVDKPYLKSRITELQNSRAIKEDATTLCPFYLDIEPVVGRVQGVVEKLGKIAPELSMVLTRTGDLHLRGLASEVRLGAETRGLAVLPADATLPPAAAITADGDNNNNNNNNNNMATTAEERLEEARSGGNAAEVTLLARHVSKALSSSQISQPARLLCGISGNLGHVHIMFVHRDPCSEDEFDDSISLSYKLPVRVDDC